MSRRRRYPPQGRVLAIPTCGRIRKRYLPRPSDELMAILAAVPGHARPSYPVFVSEICLTSVEERGTLVPPPSPDLHAAAGLTHRGGKPERSR